jgi:hypothetical protein
MVTEDEGIAKWHSDVRNASLMSVCRVESRVACCEKRRYTHQSKEKKANRGAMSSLEPQMWMKSW